MCIQMIYIGTVCFFRSFKIIIGFYFSFIYTSRYCSLIHCKQRENVIVYLWECFNALKRDVHCTAKIIKKKLSKSRPRLSQEFATRTKWIINIDCDCLNVWIASEKRVRKKERKNMRLHWLIYWNLIVYACTSTCT